MIVIVDYGVGNLFSLQASLKYLGIDSKVTGKKDDFKSADKIILPGVGAFGDAVKKLQEADLVETILKEVAGGKYMLGICLGMQLLFEKSLEYGEHSGLGLVSGLVAPLESDLEGTGLRTPHIGWNPLEMKEDPIFEENAQGDYVYYVHSYYAKNCEVDTIGTSRYGVAIPGVVRCGTVYGTQFHPEKSGAAGLRMLKSFAKL